tara:strand:- start:2801 stop:3163 length:363 start_codon:yes stop_codon:yes gene_type:complete
MVVKAVKKKKKRKLKEKQIHRVYCTYFPNGDYYIGYSGKTQKLYEKYYGSSKYVLQYVGELEKETIAEFDMKSHAKMQEFLLQWQQRKDPKCLNSMLNIRLNKEPLASFEPLEWEPKCSL